MAITDMRKVRMAVHKSIVDELIDKIQKLGCCQFIEADRERVDEKSIVSTKSRLSRVDDLLGEVRFALRFLEPFATDKGSGIARAMGDMPSVSVSELAEMASEERLSKICAEVREKERVLSDARAGMSRVRGFISQLRPLVGLPFALDLYGKGTEGIAGSLFTIPKEQLSAFRSGVISALGEMVDLYVLPTGEKDLTATVSLLYPRESEQQVQDLLTGYSVTRIDVPQQLSGVVSDELALLEREFDEMDAAERAAEADIVEIANDVYRKCQCFSDYWGIRKAQLESLISGDQTEQIVLLSFWIPHVRVHDFEKLVASYEPLIDVVVTEPECGENPPILLRNVGWASPVEPLTTMYGTPTYGAFDPTAVVAPFFYLFFGMCFGDAGYGLLISSFLLFLMLRKRVTGTLRKFFMILIIGNLSALVFGALTFSWFGDAITSFPFLKFLMPLKSLQILSPMTDPMTMLYISLTLGFIQILAGLSIAMYENLRRGDKVAAFCDQGGWMVFLIGLVLVGLSKTGVLPISVRMSSFVALAGAVVLIATQGRGKTGVFAKLFSGLMSLYNVTGYLGDVLSYSRLLALGLGSAAVGMVINLLVNLVKDMPYVGIVLAVLIFVLGHLFSIAVNILGAFIHSLRLQYVEFFGKFYEANGEDFTPLCVSTQYVKVSEGVE